MTDNIFLPCPSNKQIAKYIFATNNLCGFVPLCVVKDKKGNPHPVDIFQGKSVLRSGLLQVEVFYPVVVPKNARGYCIAFVFSLPLSLFILITSLVYSFHLPFQNQSELESVDVVNLLDLDDVDHRHRDIDVHLDDDDDDDDVDHRHRYSDVHLNDDDDDDDLDDVKDDDDVDQRHRNIDAHRDVDVLFFVKAERGDLLVVIVLYVKRSDVFEKF